MPRGGKRPGAGRKGPCQKTIEKKEIVERATLEGITPLEVMLAVMRSHYDAKNYEAAVSIAKEAAPYMHPRLTAVKHDGQFMATLMYGVEPEKLESDV